MSCQAPKDETLERLCQSSTEELSSAFSSCPGRAVYACSLRTLVRDLAEEHQLRERSTLIARLQSWITEAQTGKTNGMRYLKRVRDIRLLAFGSSVMGISSRDGDLDISLEGCINDKAVSPTGRLSDAGHGFKADLLTEVHEVLRRGHHFRHSKHTQLIRHAKVPVSKFVEPHTGIHCDLSIGNTSGVFKSALLAEVLRMDNRVRDLVVIVKKWAKANRLNDPANGSFNSYCLTLLVLSFAQSRSPPLIPSFRELFPGLRDIVCESQKDDGVDLIMEIHNFRQLAHDWLANTEREQNGETLCELLCAFFLYLSLFATHSQLLHYTAEGVSKSNSRPTCSCWDSGFVLSAWDAKALKRYQLFVEDPFEAKDNCARTLATQDWWRIVKTLQETVHLVQEFIYAPPPLQMEKWKVLWSFLFLYEPLPHLPTAIESSAEHVRTRTKALMPLHKDCLIEHLNKFKASDKKFIAVSYSWWSKEFKQFVAKAIEELGLYQGKGPKKKIIISKADNIKDDMVEHAVNSTLRARKTHNLVVDPYQCVMKQRLSEFLRCTIRYHKFRATRFDEETKNWLLRCVCEAGLKGKYVDGDLQLERPTDIRPVAMPEPVEIHGHRKELPLVSGSPADDVVGLLELDEQQTAASKLTSFALDDDEDLEDDDLSANGTETGASSCCEMATSAEASYNQHYLSSFVAAESIKIHLDVTSDSVRLSLAVIHLPVKKQTSPTMRNRKGDEVTDDLSIAVEKVRLTLTPVGDHVSLGLLSTEQRSPVRGLLSELTTVAEEERDDGDGVITHSTLVANDLHERNAEILRQVFLDLFDAMERLQDTDSFRGEIEIDPTEYVVPVSWVRQQVRDIARHLFLEIVVHNKRKRAMKIRIRKRARFDDSESDDEFDYNRRSYAHKEPRHGMEPYYDQPRRSSKADHLDRYHNTNRYLRTTTDDEDHVTRCLLWIKGMKREKSMHFQSGIYPPEVMAALRERAEELGLRLEVRESTMYISVNPNAHPYDEVRKLSAAKLTALNEKVQASIKDYFVKVMMESQRRRVESFGLPTKGYFMRPEWVAKQVIEIGRRTGYEVLKERDGTVEFYLSSTGQNQGLARFLSVPDHLIPRPTVQASQSHLGNNLTRSYSGGHYSTSGSGLQQLSSPVDSRQQQPCASHPVSFIQDDGYDPRSCNAPAGESRMPLYESAEINNNRRHRRNNHNDRRSNREYNKAPYWENDCDSKGRDYRGNRRGGKNRRGRGRNGYRHENGKTLSSNNTAANSRIKNNTNNNSHNAQ